MRGEGVETISFLKNLALSGLGKIRLKMDLWSRKLLYTNQVSPASGLGTYQGQSQDSQYLMKANQEGLNKMNQSSRDWDNFPLK